MLFEERYALDLALKEFDQRLRQQGDTARRLDELIGVKCGR
jgi:hypothetical protein